MQFYPHRNGRNRHFFSLSLNNLASDEWWINNTEIGSRITRKTLMVCIWIISKYGIQTVFLLNFVFVFLFVVGDKLKCRYCNMQCFTSILFGDAVQTKELILTLKWNICYRKMHFIFASGMLSIIHIPLLHAIKALLLVWAYWNLNGNIICNVMIKLNLSVKITTAAYTGIRIILNNESMNYYFAFGDRFNIIHQT